MSNEKPMPFYVTTVETPSGKLALLTESDMIRWMGPTNYNKIVRMLDTMIQPELKQKK